MSKAYFFGCWKEPGHYWFRPRGVSVRREESRTIPFEKWIDGGYAPRRFTEQWRGRRKLVGDPACCFVMELPEHDDRRALDYDTEEHAQGRYLLHVRDGWTLISWWDRAQGDTRGACNSNFVLEGEHNADEMVAALREHFPHVVANLERAGIVLQNARSR